MARQNVAMAKAGYREVRRVIRHGLSYPWRRYVAPAGILKRKAIRTDRSGDITVCALTSQKDWLSCMWSLASFYEFSGLRFPALIYSDGTLGESHARELATILPDGRFISSAEGEDVVGKALLPYPNCMKFRRLQPYARKILDLPILCSSPFILIFDSDVLFLKRPEELIQVLRSDLSGRFVFERDCQESYFATPAEIKERFEVDIASRVNVGIVAADVSNFDLARIERWLVQDEVVRHPWAEQTLWAMYAGRERTEILGEGYDVTVTPHIEPWTVAKHYVRPIRDFMYTEGIPYLKRHLQFPAS